MFGATTTSSVCEESTCSQIIRVVERPVPIVTVVPVFNTRVAAVQSTRTSNVCAATVQNLTDFRTDGPLAFKTSPLLLYEVAQV